MCLIIALPPLSEMKKEIDYQYIRNSWVRNSDGGGMAYVHNVNKDNAEIRIRKGFFKIDNFLNTLTELREQNKDSIFVLHHRLASYGDVSIKNCHPFVIIDKQTVMFHNGSIYKVKANKKTGVSDSFLLAKMLKELPKDWITKPVYYKLLQEYVGISNKICFLHKQNAVNFLNYNLWIKDDDGIMFSNETFKEIPKKDLCDQCGKNKWIYILNNKHLCTMCYDKDPKLLPFYSDKSFKICVDCKTELLYDFEKRINLCDRCFETHKRNKDMCSECLENILKTKEEKKSKICNHCFKKIQQPIFTKERNVYDEYGDI